MSRSDKMTVNQRRALACAQQAREHGMALSAYARKRGFNERQIYDGIAALRRKGMLPAAGPVAAAKNDFVAVRMAPTPALHGTVCRVQVGDALIQCHQWPPAAWLATLAQVGADAATPEH